MLHLFSSFSCHVHGEIATHVVVSLTATLPLLPQNIIRLQGCLDRRRS
jgi:hypothetical protein